MTEREIVLTGGRLNRVVRVGDTVRRPTGPWTPTIHALLRHLRDRQFAFGPQPGGYDDQEREILSFIPGDTIGTALPWPDWIWSEELLGEVGRVTADYHRAVADFRPEGAIQWHPETRELRGDEIVCHHDLAPYNMVFDQGRLRGIIDWDLSGPGTVVSELAFVAWQWIPLHDPYVTRAFGWEHEPDYRHRLGLLLDSYGLEDRTGFIDDVIIRIKRNRDGILQRARGGDAAYVELVRHGHIEGMNRAIAFLSQNPQLFDLD